MTRLADMAQRIAPPWGRRKWGSRILYMLFAPLDAIVDWAYQAVFARFPGIGTPTALAFRFRDVGMMRGPNESDEAAALQLSGAIPAWHTAGNVWALLDQLAWFWSPNPPLLRAVSSTATYSIWYTRLPDGTRQRLVVPINFDWDGQHLHARMFVIVYANGSAPYDKGGQWSNSTRQWGHGTVGTNATHNDVIGVKAVLAGWTAGHVLNSWLIYAFDPASFSPTAAPGAPMPDGTWANYHKIVGGVAVKARLATARYWRIM